MRAHATAGRAGTRPVRRRPFRDDRTVARPCTGASGKCSRREQHGRAAQGDRRPATGDKITGAANTAHRDESNAEQYRRM